MHIVVTKLLKWLLHTEGTLNKLSKPDLVQLMFNTKTKMSSQIINLMNKIKSLLDHQRKLEADISIFRNLKYKLGNRIVKNERQCWANVQYSRRECLEVVGIPPVTLLWRISYAISLRRLDSSFMTDTYIPANLKTRTIMHWTGPVRK